MTLARPNTLLRPFVAAAAAAAAVLLAAAGCGDDGSGGSGAQTGAQTGALAGGEPPDVFYLNDNKLPDLAKAGALEPIGDKVDNPGDFYESLRTSFTYNGTYYCPPKDFSTLQLVYNTDELAAANVKPPTTWDELAAAAKALTKPNRPGPSTRWR